MSLLDFDTCNITPQAGSCKAFQHWNDNYLYVFADIRHVKNM